MENDVGDNRIRIRAINPRRINDVVIQRAKRAVKPAQTRIGKEPPEVIKQMGSGECGNAMPNRLAGSVGLRILAASPDYLEILNRLRVDVNLDARPPAEVLDLFDNAAFRAVASVQEG